MTRSKYLLLGAFCATAVLISCGDNNDETAPVVETPENTTKEVDFNNTDGTAVNTERDPAEPITNDYDPSTDPPKIAQEVMKDRLANDPTKGMIGNTSSAFKYITTSPDYTIFGSLLINSSLDKQLHLQQVTILAPSNEYWDIEEAKALKYLVKQGKSAELDSYVKQYILDVPISAEKLNLSSEQMNMDGSYLTTDPDSYVIAGIKYDVEDIQCANGSIVIPLMGTLPK